MILVHPISFSLHNTPWHWWIDAVVVVLHLGGHIAVESWWCHTSAPSRKFFFLEALYLVILQGMHLSTSSHEHPLPAAQLRFQRTPHGKQGVSKILYLARTATHNSRKFPLISLLLRQVVTHCSQKKHFTASSRGFDKIFIGVEDVLISSPKQR